MRQNLEASSGDRVLNEFQFEESGRLFEQISALLTELTAVHERNKKLGSIYYLDEVSVRSYHNKNNNGKGEKGNEQR